MPAVTVLIRFKNSAATLPGVLAAIRAQTVQPAQILGIDTGSTDGSAALIREAGGEVILWDAPYHHARVLNFGAKHCAGDLVLVLSSHTVLHDADTLAGMIEAMSDPLAACVSGRWGGDDGLSDAIEWDELRKKGIRFCSIYSNSFGMFRRRLWEELPFDEKIVTMEDFAWALAQVHRGYTCRRLTFRFSYQRAAQTRDFTFAAVAFRLAARHRLRLRWLGLVPTLSAVIRGWFRASPEQETHRARLRAALLWRFYSPTREC